MNRRDEIIYTNLVKEASTYTTETMKCILSSGIVLLFTIITYIVFFLCGKSKPVNRALKVIMNYSRSILAGIIIGMNYLIRYNEISLLNTLSGSTYYLMHICPSMQLLFCLLLIAICFPIYRMAKKSNSDDDIYRAVSSNENNNTPMSDDLPEINDNSKTSRFLLRMKYLLDRVSVAKISSFKNFNNHYAPIINLSSILLLAFYSGLGFGGFEVFGWYEIIIFIHKIFEVYCINQSLSKLRIKRNYLLTYLVVFCLLTPFGILLRGYFKIHNTY